MLNVLLNTNQPTNHHVLWLVLNSLCCCCGCCCRCEPRSETKEKWRGWRGRGIDRCDMVAARRDLKWTVWKQNSSLVNRLCCVWASSVSHIRLLRPRGCLPQLRCWAWPVIKQEVKVIWQKSASRGPIPRLGVTPGGRKLYHWIPGVGLPISVP